MLGLHLSLHPLCFKGGILTTNLKDASGYQELYRKLNGKLKRTAQAGDALFTICGFPECFLHSCLNFHVRSLML